MNRYNRGGAFGGHSRATSSTTCQKCLKKGHYSYECNAVVQERPYVSRPSRSQQLLNPKLVPKLTSDVPPDLLRKKGIADEQLAKLEQERSRKRDRQSEDPELKGVSKRMRSASSVSVSTISTSSSRSPSPSSQQNRINKNRRQSDAQSPPPRSDRRALTDSERKRRRDSMSSAASYSSEERTHHRHDSRDRASSRSTRRRFQQHSPPPRGRQTLSRSPQRVARRRLSDDRQRGHVTENSHGLKLELKEERKRERSLSPFSKRLALTQSMNIPRQS